MAAPQNAGRPDGRMTPARWEQIEETFHRAAECDPERRASLLDELCGEDRELRQEVDALLSCDQRATANLQSAVNSGLRSFSFPKSDEPVSHYRILSGLGSGGMGVVYEAEDIKLGRRVALKFLPEELANDPAAMDRFEREAKAASALNHPNICTIHTVEEHEGQPFIVMELLEGRTLRDVLSESTAPVNLGGKTLLPLGDLLDTAIQIASGLEAAHKKGIIHRDIKPANIFVTSRGQVKILDFGLAKLKELGGPQAESTDSPARPVRPLSNLDLTGTGLAIGTAGYMSPEQVRGEQLDTRTDLFSFGLVLYEMAAGCRAFSGETDVQLRAAILGETPKGVREHNPQIPEKLERIVTRVLAKSREDRYQTPTEIRADLQAVLEEVQAASPNHAAIVWAATAILAVTAGSAWYVTRRPTVGPLAGKWRQRQLTVNSSENPLTGGTILPDGKYLAYTDQHGMHLKNIASGESQPIAVPSIYERDLARWEIGPWLPDSGHFYAIAEPPLQPSALWIISAAGGAQQQIANGANPWGVSPDGTLLAVTTNDDHENLAVETTWRGSEKISDKRRRKYYSSGAVGSRWARSGVC